MPVYRIAGLNVLYEPKYEVLKQRSEKYIVDAEPDFKIGVKDSVIEEQYEFYKGKVSKASLEYLWVGSAFHSKLLEYNGFYLHSSTVVVDGMAYSFTAPCGTGKSTHTSLWLKLPLDAFIINDDKTVFRKIDGKYIAFGTPFSGKNDINVNTSAQLKGICIIEQSADNSIERMDIDAAVPLLISQTVRPTSAERTVMMCDFLDELLGEIPIYKLKCNTKIEAAELSYKTMSR
ncbi:MAG: hypothetical protein PUB20_06710 [Clostridia bacterium]|nr:hypothetical protein [Clostridia bacterium]